MYNVCQDFLYGRVGSSQTRKSCSYRFCRLLALVCSEDSHRLLVDLGRLSFWSVFSVHWDAKGFDPAEDWGAYERGVSVSRFKGFPTGCCGMLLAVLGYTLTLSLDDENISIYTFALTYDEKMSSPIAKFEKGQIAWPFQYLFYKFTSCKLFELSQQIKLQL